MSGLRWSDVSARHDPGAVAAGLRGLGRVAGRLRRPAAHLPGRRLADAERGRPGAVRPHRKPPAPRSPGTAAACAGAGDRPARSRPAPSEPYNHQFHNGPQLGPAVPRAPPAAPPRSAPAPRWPWPSPDGQVASLPAVGRASSPPAVLARCPLTVVDLGSSDPTERARPLLASADAELAADRGRPARRHHAAGHRARGHRPSRRTCSSPWSAAPATRPACCDAASTRQPGLVVLTDLTPTVLGWLGRSSPADAVGARDHPGRPGRAAARRRVADRPGHRRAGVAVHPQRVLLDLRAGRRRACWPGSGWPAWGAAPERRRRRAARVAGGRGVRRPRCPPARSWPTWCRGGVRRIPALWLYAVTAAWAAVIARGRAGSARGGVIRSGRSGVICRVTLVVLGIDVMTGSRLQLGTPFGLSVLEAGRFYGIGNEALGIYAHRRAAGRGLAGAAALRRFRPSRRPGGAGGAAWSRCSRWSRPAGRGFGGKVGGTIAMVPCFLLLVLAVAGVRITTGAGCCSSRSAGWPCSRCSR